MATFRQVFPYAYLLRWGPYDRPTIETLVVAGSRHPIDRRPFEEQWPLREQPGRRFATKIFTSQELSALLAGGRSVVLTDDYAPINQLTAPLFPIRN